MSLARRLAAHFVAPIDDVAGGAARARDALVDAPRPAPTGRAARAPATVALLAAAADAPAFGAALGLALARRRRAPAAAVCLWTGGDLAGADWRAPALPAARRLAAGLAVRGHEVRAAGRLAVVRLPAVDDDAAAQARRVLAAAANAPAVLALGGPRGAAFAELLAEQDLVVVATRSGADPLLTQLALEGLAGPARACSCELPGAASARSLATAGLALLPSARRALAGPVAQLP